MASLESFKDLTHLLEESWFPPILSFQGNLPGKLHLSFVYIWGIQIEEGIRKTGRRNRGKMGWIEENGKSNREKSGIEEKITWSWTQSWAICTSSEWCPDPRWCASTTSSTSWSPFPEGPIFLHFSWEMIFLLLILFHFSFHFVSSSSYSEKLSAKCINLHLPKLRTGSNVLYSCYYTVVYSWLSMSRLLHGGLQLIFCGLGAANLSDLRNSCSDKRERAQPSTGACNTWILCECVHWIQSF